MKVRKKLARLGRVRASHTDSPCYRATSNGTTVSFKQLWARSGDEVHVPISDVLDFAINRRIAANGRRITISLCPAGIRFREEGQISEQIVSFHDLLELLGGQRLISHAP